jgi:hypothetical protein
MAAEKAKDGSGIFSNITVKQSMSSSQMAGSPKGEKSNTSFTNIQKQIMQEENKAFSVSVYQNFGPMASRSATRIKPL